MKLKEYIKNLQKFVAENPDSLDYDVVCSKDDEGNGYNKVIYTPGLGEFKDGDFVSVQDEEGFKELGCKVNAVCVN